MSDLDHMPKGWQRVIRWTSPGWYVYLAYFVGMLVGAIIYYMIVDE